MFLTRSVGSLPFFGLKSTKILPTSGHASSSFSSNTLPRKPVAPVTKIFCPSKNWITPVILFSVCKNWKDTLKAYSFLKHIRNSKITLSKDIYFQNMSENKIILWQIFISSTGTATLRTSVIQLLKYSVHQI